MPLEKIDALSYSQERFANKHGGKGVCFRLAFLWAATKLVGGEFNYALDKKGIDVDTTIREFDAYVAPAAAMGARPGVDWLGEAALKELAGTDAAQAMTFINRWGVSFKDRKGTTYGGVKTKAIKEAKASVFLAGCKDADVTFILGYYGREAGKPNGHAVAYSDKRFFDPNHGAYFCNAPTPAAIGADIDAHIAQVDAS
ncbi:MAG: hypothetical protein MUC89_10520 [Acetobacteraceae bacterium]|jgi:hypothetical protein|nr:hypothetical protein [Acetobacteraceae bacterium]